MQPRWHRLLGFVFPVPSSQVGKIALTIFRWHLCAASHINCSDPASWIFDEYLCSNDFRWIDNTDNSNQNQPKTNRANISHIYNFFELQTSNRIELILNRPFFFFVCHLFGLFEEPFVAPKSRCIRTKFFFFHSWNTKTIPDEDMYWIYWKTMVYTKKNASK